MSTVSTKNAESGKFTPFGLTPGNVKAKVNKIELKQEPYATKRNEYMLYLHLESEPVGNGWTGFDKEYGNPAAGKCLGQSAKVRASRWNFYDGVSPSGYDQSVQKDVLGILKDLCAETGCSEYFVSIDSKYETIALVVDAVNKALPFKDVFIQWCLGGREYTNKKNYLSYDLFVVRGVNGYKGFCADANKVVKYDPSLHIIKQKPKELKDGFEAKPKPTPVAAEKKNALQPNTSFTAQVDADAKAQASKATADETSDLPFDLD